MNPTLRRMAAAALLAAAWTASSRVGEPREAAAKAAARCADQLLEGLPPNLPPIQTRGSRYLCYPRFTALTSTLTRTGLWSAERLQGSAARAAYDVVRRNPFHPEASLPHAERAELADYRGSGLDRGHLTPNGDEPDQAEDTFTLAQMIPQDPDNNRHLWLYVEHAARTLAIERGEAYIVTGAMFRSQSLRILNGRVYVPTDLWKAVYVPSTASAGVYVATNAPGRSYRLMDVAAFSAETGIDPFPGLPRGSRTTSAGMPPIKGGDRR